MSARVSRLLRHIELHQESTVIIVELHLDKEGRRDVSALVLRMMARNIEVIISVNFST